MADSVNPKPGRTATSSKRRSTGPMQDIDESNELGAAVAVLTHNFFVYSNRIFSEYLKRELFEDMGYYIYGMDDRAHPAKYFGLSPKDWGELINVVRRMRARKYMMGENDDSEGRLYGKAAVAADAEVLKQAIESFRKKNKIKPNAKVKYNKSVKTLIKMFKLNTPQADLLQFLFDLEVSLDSRILKEEYFSLFCHYETKPLFKNSLFEIIRIYVGDVSKKDLQGLLDIGIISEVQEDGYPECAGASSSNAVTPFWPAIQKIYIRLILQNKPLDFKSITSYFRDSFKKKLTYADFKNLEHTPIVEKLINRSLLEGTVGTNVLFYGMPGTGKTEMIHALAKENNWELIVIGENEDQEPRERLEDLRFAQNFFKNFKDKRIVFLFDEMEDLLNIKREEMSKNAINRVLENSPFPIFWTTNNVERYDSSFVRRMTFAQKFDIPSKKRRKALWDKFAKENNLSLDNETLTSFAENYHAAPSVISSVTEIANKAQLEMRQTKKVIEGLLTAYNHGDEPNMVKDSYLGQFIPYEFSLANTDTSLSDMMERLKTSSSNWNMCLYGAPGTGKSAYARHLAKVLGIKIIYKRASDLISMWVGETEKNIAAAFREAEEDEALLVLDEADSFLSSRSNARNSWEVTAVNEMLTHMENSKHPFICTTNLIDNLDEASLRRFVFKVKFDWMTTEQIKLAFQTFFKVDVDVPGHWRLSPGDFVSVAKRVKILGNHDKEEVFKLIEAEFKLKKLDGSKPIGFGK